MIFIDTSAWFASVVPSDQNYSLAEKILAENRQLLITTDYVLDELVTLLRSRGFEDKAIEAGEAIISEEFVRIEYLTRADIDLAWDTFKQYRDKPWSFTDCTSRVVMQRLEITTAFAFDEDFRQFGTVEVVPALAA